VQKNESVSVPHWAKSWAEIINNARARLEFINKQLAYQADKDSAIAYLHKAHAKFIPESVSQ
jgi:hypothetical protein